MRPGRRRTDDLDEESDMTGPDGDGDGGRTVAEDGTQTEAQGSPSAGRSAGPAPSAGGAQEPGGPVPPYAGRRESADIDSEGADRDGAHVGGATGPVISSGPADDPASTPLGRTASPTDDAEGTEVTEGTEVAEHQPDPGVGPAHQAGVNKAEDEPE
jgi:hypothetical protein